MHRFRGSTSYNPLHAESKSETTDKFDYKPGTYKDLTFHDRTYQSNRPHLVKQFSDSNYWNTSSVTKTPKTTNNLCYEHNDTKEDWNFTPHLDTHYTLDRPQYNIDPSANCYSKYLDGMSSTTMLDHHQMVYDNSPLSPIADHNEITFQNWLKKKDNHELDYEQTYNKYLHMKKYYGDQGRLRTVPRLIPHGRLLTDMNCRYRQLNKLGIDIGDYNPPLVPFSAGKRLTEHSMYGSGKRVDEFHNCKCKHGSSYR